MKKQELINLLGMLDIVADQVSRESLPQESEPVCASPISVMYRMRDRIKSLEQERILEFCDVKNENTRLRSIAVRARDIVNVSPESSLDKWQSTDAINQLIKECDEILSNVPDDLPRAERRLP